MIMKKMLDSKTLYPVTLRFQNDHAWKQFRKKIVPGLVKEENIGNQIEVNLLTDSLFVLGQWLVESPCKYDIIQPAELRAITHDYALEGAQSYLDRA